MSDDGRSTSESVWLAGDMSVSGAEYDGDSHSIMAALANSQYSAVAVAMQACLKQDGLMESPQTKSLHRDIFAGEPP